MERPYTCGNVLG